MFVKTKHVLCCNKSMLVVTRVCHENCHVTKVLSSQKYFVQTKVVAASMLLSWQKTRLRVCRDKSFVVTNILVAAPANDMQANDPCSCKCSSGQPLSYHCGPRHNSQCQRNLSKASVVFVWQHIWQIWTAEWFMLFTQGFQVNHCSCEFTATVESLCLHHPKTPAHMVLNQTGKWYLVREAYSRGKVVFF